MIIEKPTHSEKYRCQAYLTKYYNRLILIYSKEKGVSKSKVAKEAIEFFFSKMSPTEINRLLSIHLQKK